MPYFSARPIKSAIESVFSVESLSGVPDERPSRKASFVFCMSVVSMKNKFNMLKRYHDNLVLVNKENGKNKKKKQ